MSAFIQWIPPVGYGIVASLYLLWLLDGEHEETRSLLRTLVGATFLHLVVLGIEGVSRGRLPFASMGEALSVSALFLSIAYVVVEWRVRTASLGAFFIASVFVATALSVGLRPSVPWPPQLHSPLFAVHAGTGAAGLAILFASSLLGGGYLLQYRQLERKRFGGLSRRLPSLPTLENAFRFCGSFGTVLLVLSTVTGAVWIRLWGLTLEGAEWKSILVLSAVAWFAVATLLGHRRSFTSVAAARLAMLGGILVILVVLAGAHG
jgi:ABC-type uncharacterized transport system permease subunit